MYGFLMIEVSLTDARARLPELLTRAAEGEEVHILRHGVSVGVLVGHDRWVKTQAHDVLLHARELRRQRESARGKPWPPPEGLSGDPAEYDDSLRQLAEDRDADRREQWGE